MLIAIEAIAGAKIIVEWFPQFEVWQVGVAVMALEPARRWELWTSLIGTGVFLVIGWLSQRKTA